LIWNGKPRVCARASDPSWVKWGPADPTSAHWYDAARLERLMAAYIARDQDHGRNPRTVREFVSEFRGLSSSAKQKAVLDDAGASRLSLPKFFGGGDQVNKDGIAKLLAAMQRHSRPVKPADLGVIGKDHLAARLEAAGAAPESFQYRRMLLEANGLPQVIEAAFGFCPNGRSERRQVVGANWSPGIVNPFRVLGPDERSLDSILTEQRAGDRSEPIIFVLHLAHPRIEYTDRGKSSVVFVGSKDEDEDGEPDDDDDIDGGDNE
jgi:hypothetical protein